MSELKTPVKRFQFLDNQRAKNGPARKRLDYTDNYSRIYRKVLREAKTRENDKHIKS
jgi:hypothetical protein